MMDEIKFKANCGRNCFYIPLQDHQGAITTLETNSQRLRQTVSKDHSTYVHLVIEHEQHWAAVQISISPFSIQCFPGQIFYSSHLRYSLCCQSAKNGPSIDRIINVVQRIYDVYYRPAEWDFSVKHCYTCDPPSLDPRVYYTACTNRAEQTVLEYIRVANGSAEAGDSVLAPLENADVDGFACRNKRRRLNPPKDFVLQGRIDDNGGKEIGDSDERDTDLRSEIQLDDRSITDEDKKAITNLTKKIKRGISAKLSRKRKGTSSQLQVQVRPTDVGISEFKALIANEKSGIEDRSTCLEALLWTRASALVANAQEMAWKYRFLAACLRSLRREDKDVSEAENYSLWRWTRASRIVNSIVDGLWEAWGPKAGMVYEALAVKNYLLSDISSVSEHRQRQIVTAVVSNLSKTAQPGAPLDDLVFHPAACISAVMNLEYYKVCRELGLNYFADLGPTCLSGIQVSMLLLERQWDERLIVAPTDSSHLWTESSYGHPSTSQFDVLTAVAVARINSSSSEAIPGSTTHLVDELRKPMQNPGPVNTPPVLVGDSPLDCADQEQLARNNLLPRELPSNIFNLEESWDIPELSGWLDPEGCPPLFNIEPHFDIFGNPEQLNESHSLMA